MTGSSPASRRAAGLAILAALAGVFIFLAIEGVPGFFQEEQFYKGAGNFWGYIDQLLFGTVLAATIALIVAVPLAFGIALVVSHYAPRWIAGPVAYVIDLLAAVPSVVFGLWGINLFAPKMVPIYEWLNANLGWLPFFKGPVEPGRHHDPDGRPRAGHHDPADRHRHLP